jgi:hypothetical protein
MRRKKKPPPARKRRSEGLPPAEGRAPRPPCGAGLRFFTSKRLRPEISTSGVYEQDERRWWGPHPSDTR